jgi:plasmid stabilization system protein ParE
LGRPEKVKGDWRTTFWANSSGKTEDYGWPTGLSLTPQAAADLKSAYRYIRRHAPGAAREWIRRARRSVKTLSNQPPTLPTGPREQFLMTNPSASWHRQRGNIPVSLHGGRPIRFHPARPTRVLCFRSNPSASE